MDATQTQPTFSVEGTYTPAIMEKGTILTLNLQSNLSLKSKNKHALVVLDISGSMQGEKLETSKKSISELIETLFQQDAHPKVDLITFDDKPYFYPLQGKSKEECLKIISEIQVNGGTCFIPVFDMIQGLINGTRPPHTKPRAWAWHQPAEDEKPEAEKTETGEIALISELAVVFLSDGQAENFETLKPHIAKLKNVSEEKLASAEFHTLGMGAGHDARLLGEMTKAMPTEGTFQYVRDAVEVTSCIEAISSCLTEKRFTSFVAWGEGKASEKKVNFVSQDSKARKPGMEASWQATVCLNMPTEEFEKTQKNLKLNLKLGDQFMVLEIPTTFKKPEGKLAEIRQNFAFINDQLRTISDSIIEGGFEAKQAEEWRDNVAGYRVMLNEVTREIFKLKIDDRKLIIESAKDLSDYMDKIGELLRASANKGLTNEQIASINAMAYRQVTKKANLKTLDKRALQNVDLLNSVTQKAKEVAENLNEKEFTEKNEALIKEVGCCALNITNLPETLKAEDCLCLTFNIGRPEVAIQDASRIIIKQIYPTLICASAFLDSVKYSMNLNPNNSGGFDASFQGEIVKGASNEKITAALPLYFCNEHWGIAKEYIKPILGWDVTIDPLGYDYNQLRTVPFLLLQKALTEKKRNPNEFNTRVANWILETCKRIIQDEIDQNVEANLAKTVKDTWVKYLTDGTVRGVEVVQSNYVFLTYVYCLQEMGIIQAEDKEVTLKKLKYMIEEEMRRRQDKKTLWNGNVARKHVRNILQLDAEHYLELLRKNKVVEEKKEEVEDNETFESKEKRYQEAYSKAKENQPKIQVSKNKEEREAKNKEKAEENKEQEKDKNFEFTVPEEFLAKDIDVISIFPGDVSSLTGARKEYLNQATQSYKNVAKSFKHWFELFNVDVQDIEKHETIGINNLVQLFALYIQNKIQHKNSDRLESFKSGTYIDAFNQQQADAYIAKLARQTIFNAWNKELNSKPKDRNCSPRDIEFFIQTENLEAAAGLIVKGFNLGSFESLQNSLRKDPKACKKVFEKLLMLRHKEYNGAKFNMDFKPLKKFSRQLFVKYKDAYDYNTWRELWFVEKKKSK